MYSGQQHYSNSLHHHLSRCHHACSLNKHYQVPVVRTTGRRKWKEWTLPSFNMFLQIFPHQQIVLHWCFPIFQPFLNQCVVSELAFMNFHLLPQIRPDKTLCIGSRIFMLVKGENLPMKYPSLLGACQVLHWGHHPRELNYVAILYIKLDNFFSNNFYTD